MNHLGWTHEELMLVCYSIGELAKENCMGKRILYLPDIQEIENNFLYAYMAAGSPKDDFWYNDVYFRCLELAVEYRVYYEIVAAVIATLSPVMPWSKNIHNARKIIEFVLANKTALLAFFHGRVGLAHLDMLDAITELFSHVQGYNTNKAKALFVVLYNDVTFCRGEKVSAFYDNIAHPESNKVTIDIWMIRMGLFYFDLHIKRNPYTKYSAIFQQAIINVAYRLDIQPKQLQAIVWKQSRVIGRVMAPIITSIENDRVIV